MHLAITGIGRLCCDGTLSVLDAMPVHTVLLLPCSTLVVIEDLLFCTQEAHCSCMVHTLSCNFLLVVVPSRSSAVMMAADAALPAVQVRLVQADMLRHADMYAP